MTINEQKQYRRRQINRIKRELAAMRTAHIADSVQEILSNPEKTEFLATLVVLWRLQLSQPTPGNTGEERATNRTLIALDEALRSFANHESLLEADTEYIRDAEAPFAPLPQGWSYDATDAETSPRFPSLPVTTWRFVFFKDGKLAAGFEDIADARAFFDHLQNRHADPSPRISDAKQLTKKEAATPGLFIKRKNHYGHASIMRKVHRSDSAFTVSVMPPLTPSELEDTIADRIVAALNLANEEVERYWQNR